MRRPRWGLPVLRDRLVRRLPSLIAVLALGLCAAGGDSGAEAQEPALRRDFPANGVTLLGRLSVQQMREAPDQLISDVWGYVSPGGREYAIVGLVRGTAFVDVTNPRRPMLVRRLRGPRAGLRDIKTYGERAYIVNDVGPGRGIQIVDLRRIDRGRVRRAGFVTAEGLERAHNFYINKASGYAYLCGGTLPHTGIVDLNSAGGPRLLEEGWDGHCHDIHVVTHEDGPHAGREIAYVSGGLDGFFILDVTDKADIRELAHLDYATRGYAHSGWLSDSGKVFYLDDEFDEHQGKVPGGSIYVIDVRDLTAPRLIRRVGTGTPAIDHNSMVLGDRLYIAHYAGGLRVLDISRERRPRPSGFFDTHPGDDDLWYAGAFGVYVLPSGTVLISDRGKGLFTLRVEEP